MTLQKFEHESPITEIIEFGVPQKSIRKTEASTLINHSEKMRYMLERFSHACIHELKEPLRNSANFLHLLSDKNKRQFDKESLNHLYYIRQNISRMDALIKDVAYYLSIVKQTNQTKEIVNINEIIYNISKNITNKMLENDTQFIISALPSVFGIRVHIHKLFLNLIDNALKFRSQKPLQIKVFSMEQENFWEFHVCDNGLGIGSEYHESIFNMFSRLHTKDSYDGSGMGLAICKEIMQEHHGEIKVISHSGYGSEFIVTFPKTFIKQFL